MKQSEKKSLEQALVECIIIQLIREGAVAIPGFGSFSAAHQPASLTGADPPSDQPEASSGELHVSISPPKTVVLFSPKTELLP